MTEPNIVCWTYGHDYKWHCDGDENWTECRLCGEIGRRWTYTPQLLTPDTDARNVIEAGVDFSTFFGTPLSLAELIEIMHSDKPVEIAPHASIQPISRTQNPKP